MKTIVLSLIIFFTTVVMMSTGALAQQLSAPAINYEQASKECELQGKTSGSARTSCLQKLLHGSKEGAFDDSCKSAKDSLSKFQSEFSKACGQFSGLSIGGSCEKAYQSCDSNGLNNYDDEEDNDSDEKSVSKDKYASCPMPAIKDAKKAKEEIKDLEGKIDDYEDKLNQAKEKVGKAKTDITEAESARAQANSEAKIAHEKETSALTEGYEEQTKSATEKIEAAEAGIRKLEQEKNDQAVQRKMDEAKIDGICQEIAEKALSAKITAEVNNVSKSQQKQRDLQAQLTLRAKGRTAQNEAFRQREIARCKEDPAKHDQPKALLELNYANNILKIEKAIGELLTKIGQLRKELSESLPKKAQEQMQTAQNQYSEKQALIKQQFDTKIGSCMQGATALSGSTSQPAVANNCSGLQGELSIAMDQQNQLQTKLDTAKADLQYYKELLRAASSVLKDPDASDVLSLTNTGGDYKSALKDVLDSCTNSDLNSRQMTTYRKNFEIAGGDTTDLAEPAVSSTKEVDAIIKEALAPTKTPTASSKAKTAAPPATSKSGDKKGSSQ